MGKTFGQLGPALKVAALSLTVAMGGLTTLGATSAIAQGAKKPQNAWVKLCNKQQVPKRGADGKVARAADGKVQVEVKDMCLTHHERIDGRTGLVLVSAAIRQLQGSKERTLLLMVPLGMALQPGVKAAIYSPAQWAEAIAGKQIDAKAIKPMKLNYTMCHASGCFAEMPADDNLVTALKKGGGLMVGAMNAVGRPVVLPVDLTGFTKALDGKPVDNKLYAAARKKAMSQIYQNRQRAIADLRKRQQAAQRLKQLEEERKKE
ncbi:MAG: invasion associated locus B family protein [Pseudomonadota bacterium]